MIEARVKRSLRLKLRSLVRRNPRVYALFRVFKYAPFMGVRAQAVRAGLLKTAERDSWLVLYLGSGGRRQRGMVNLDVTMDTGPDVVGDGYRLPFLAGSFDAIFCEYVVEHVEDAERFIKSASHVLKHGGVWYIEAPFLQPIHADGIDFARWTKRGFEAALSRCGLRVLESGVHTGPAYVLFWVLKDALALLLSGGIKPLRAVLRYVFAWILSPLLALDWLFLRLSGSEALASGYYFVASPDRTSREASALDRS